MAANSSSIEPQNPFLFSQIPLKLKELILGKISIDQRLESLKINHVLRDFGLKNGPFGKRIPWIELNILDLNKYQFSFTEEIPASEFPEKFLPLLCGIEQIGDSDLKLDCCFENITAPYPSLGKIFPKLRHIGHLNTTNFTLYPHMKGLFFGSEIQILQHIFCYFGNGVMDEEIDELGIFFEKHLQYCESITIYGEEAFLSSIPLLKRSNFRRIFAECSTSHLKEIIEVLIKDGVPSRFSEAGCHFRVEGVDRQLYEAHSLILRKDLEAITDLEIPKTILFPFEKENSFGWFESDEKMECFRKRFDPKMELIFVLVHDDNYFFYLFAKMITKE